MRGFSRETLIALLTNIESQEHRRALNDTHGPEHPRASSTHEVESFISCVRDRLGKEFDIKELKQRWPAICNEYKKRIDNTLPFYYWTTKHDRYREGQMPSFDISVSPVPRLQRMTAPRRQDPGIFVRGRADMPLGKSKTIRATFQHAPAALPPAPDPDVAEQF